MQAYLKKHAPGHAGHTIKVNWTVEGRVVALSFVVSKRGNSSWYADENFSQDWSENWGLWDNDVVESFLQLRSHEGDLTAPYLEVQISPLNQPFALIITEPRKSYHAPKVLDFTHSVNLSEKSWEAFLKVTLPEDLKEGTLFGSFFACLGSGDREFYALENNPEINPDFHRPELFQKLVEL